MTLFLETRRLVLRRFTPDDAEARAALDGDPAVLRFITGDIATSRTGIEDDSPPAFLVSRRVTEKAGLRYVRTFVADWPVRIEGDEHGDVEHALTLQERQVRP
ncbi:hypothetical protein H5398_06565 [Tessaracoccus sp. MC1679]|uniref:GNAT family N-acetyltransferase n=1 Tax=Tessaracoccus sp. MC1679 TaxID=2760313 RepID=UPI00160066D7|nr:hypothetical protein [Tessaracoccus sp. MC1679]MBB1515639.1 hypothetical protein [Tessaracoccus sp. MC1679]